MRNIILFIFVILFADLLFISGCSSSANKNISKKEEIDTLRQVIPPSVNSAEIEAEIIGVTEKDGYINSNLKILEVKDYGASVPPLPVGSIIEASISQTAISNSKLSKEELLKKGSQHRIILEHFILPPGVKGPSWKILSIK